MIIYNSVTAIVFRLTVPKDNIHPVVNAMIHLVWEFLVTVNVLLRKLILNLLQAKLTSGELATRCKPFCFPALKFNGVTFATFVLGRK